MAKHRPALPAACFAFLAFLFGLVLPAAAAPDPYLTELLARSHAEDLSRERTWEVLLHYRTSRLIGGSLVDDPDFFLAPNGKRNPRAELEATLGAFFLTDSGDDHPRCRFPARFAWLQERLDIDEQRLPAVSCTELNKAMEKVQPRSVVLIFPGSHVNSPASMFGHTLLNVEGPYKSRLLSYAVNYSAFTTENNGFIYAFKGITGLYEGYFSVLPYYQKVREYNDMERRDIWEYELDFDPPEVTRLFLHVWELQNIYSDYYFFGENCSFNLLFLLEAARPSLRLVDQARPWVIPSDTIRIVGEAGLIREASYRPSKATRMNHLVSGMSPQEKDAAEALLRGRLDPAELHATTLGPEERRRVLDLAIETVEFRYHRKELDLEEYRRRYLALLKERSTLGVAENAPPIPVPVRPDHGHGSNRLGPGGGVRKGDAFLDLRLRPAYHHLLDSDDGYLAGSQIIFADLTLRWYPDRNRGELHRFDVIDIISLSPRHRFYRPVSWKVSTGFVRKTFRTGEHLVYRLNPGGGFTWGNERAMTYVLGETDVQGGGRFRDNFAAGVGASAGILATPLPSWKVHLWGRKVYFPLGDSHQNLELHLQQSLRTGPNSTIALELSRQEEFDHWFSEVRLGWNYFW